MHSDKEARPFGQKAGEFTPWEVVGKDTNLLFYEGLHGGVVDGDIDVAQYVDLLIGVVPVVNLEWIQKIHRDKEQRGYSAEATVDTIHRRMWDYINYITPQFSRTHINFQRVPTVDTSNPLLLETYPLLMRALWLLDFETINTAILCICKTWFTTRFCLAPTPWLYQEEKWAL